LEEEVEGSNDGGSALVACTSRAISNFSVDQKPIVKKDKKKDLCNYCKKTRHWARDYKKKANDLKEKDHTKEMATIVEQTFSATMNELENKTWYIDS
jgi:hypothetical protein